MNKIIYLTVLVITMALAGCGSKDSDEIIIDGEVVSDIGTASFVYSEENNKKTLEKSDKNAGADDSVNEESEEKKIFIVYVCGEVKSPGVYEIYEDSRVVDAINVAGGVNENASVATLNLASFISDGEKIYVPSVDEVAMQEINNIQNNGGNAGGSNSSLININTADKEQLMTLPGVGESKANKIIAYREEHGKFSKPEDLMQVSGIKEGMYNKIKDYICAN